MKRIFTIVLLFIVGFTNAQLLSTSPAFIQENSAGIVITADATKGNQGLNNYTPTSDVYVHMGAITSKSTTPSDWKYLPFNSFSTAYPAANCAYLGNNKWSFTINSSLRSFFGITDATETIKKIAILFRAGNGSKKLANADGSDMYITVYDANLNVRIDAPPSQPLFTPVIEPLTKVVGDAISITANASQSSTIKLFFNGVLLSTTSSATTASSSVNITATGNQQIIAEATAGTSVKADTLQFVVASSNTVAALPAGLKDGINYNANDNTTATLVLYAPNKGNVFVVGDFNNWAQSSQYQMNITPDGLRYWIKLTGLVAATEYAFQYVIDGNLKVADYTAEKVLDPFNDQYIPAATYPNLKAYPTGKTSGIVSILQTAKPVYNWQVPNFSKPDKRNLIIYELLVRDFTAAQNWKTTKDTLSYLKRLGINAIELMPINEFEGNNSWGYNPSFFFAPDKAYGTDVAFKDFIDACHAQGIAVIMDIAMNHAFGESPMVRMYFDAVNNRPAANSPWFNQVATHPYSVGYDFNHESQATKDLVDNVVTHWLTNYKIDGFRWDLSKGFTQVNSGTNVGLWGNYDQSRINIWKRIYDKMQAVAPSSYCILEHFADNSEETVLSDYGMLLWGNLNYNYSQATMGYNNGSDVSNTVAANKGWSQPNLVAYQESHDEERLMFQNINYGNQNTNTGYNTKTLSTATKRMAMSAAIWSMIPGPKMLWQFGELGYDYSINTCPNLSISNNCRTDPKPVKWDYYQDANRKGLYDVYSKLFALRTSPQFKSTFTTGAIANNYSLTSYVKQLRVVDPNLSVVAFGNFDVSQQFAIITFPGNGTWYNYLNPSAGNITVAGNGLAINLQPGEYYVYTSKDANAAILPVTWLSFVAEKGLSNTVNLQWMVTNQVNNDHYEVERSSNGASFVNIGSVASNNSVQSSFSYNFIDKQPIAGTIYYRIKQVDKDGKYSYSIVQIITVGNNEVALWQTYPTITTNAAGTALHLKGDVGKVQILVTDVLGKTVVNFSSTTANGQQINIPLKGVTKGVFLLHVNTDKAQTTEKIIVQ